jgi:hypothetical protein
MPSKFRPAEGAGFIASCVFSLIVVYSVFFQGIPGFRHDWSFTNSPGALEPSIALLWEPWQDAGIGGPNPYPTAYSIGFVLYWLRWIGPSGVAAIVVVSSIFLASASAYRYARSAGSGVVGGVAIAAVASLNPWVYTKEIAGHVNMVLAYAVWLCLIAELAQPLRRGRLALLCGLSITQIEFFFIGLAPLVWALWRRREPQLITVAIVAALPVVIGIAADYQQLRATPYLLPWQVISSIAPFTALVLRGYPPDFDGAGAFGAVRWALYPLAAAGIIGLTCSMREAFPRTIGILAILCFTLCTGVHGPLRGGYAWLVLHIPETGLFRELYDLVAVLAIAYCVGLAQLCRRYHRAEPVIAGLASALFIPWIASPVYAHTVPLRDFSVSRTPASVSERVAFLPAFQPLSLNGRGSGRDPDTVVPSGHAMSLNEFLPGYPVDRVLAQLESEGLDGPAEALGVAEIIVRPTLATDIETLQVQARFPVQRSLRVRTHRTENPWPIVGVVPPPTLASIADDPREDAVSIADSSAASGKTATHLVLPAGDRRISDATKGWVDARLLVRFHPEWATASGGILTASAMPFRLPPARRVLAAAFGKLMDQDNNLIADQPELQWLSLPPRAVAVFCEGACIVAALGNPPASVPPHGPYIEPAARSWHYVMPWLAVVSLNPQDAGTLRFAVRYDRWWVALDRLSALRHVRLASSLNGWSIPIDHGRRVILIEGVAAAQFFLEMFATALMIGCALAPGIRSL